MPAILANAKHFRTNTDYPLEKLMFVYTGSVAGPNIGGGTFTIPHGLPFAPLPIMVWSTSSDFSVTNEGMDEQMGDGAVIYMGVGREYNAYGDSTNITVEWYANTASSATIYYRIICFAPSTASKSSIIAATATGADNFVLNSDINYMKLAYTGVINPATPTFTHGLGYYPRYQCWENVPGLGWGKKIMSTVVSDMALGQAVSMSTTALSLIGGSAASYYDIEYRIYLDE